MEQTADWPASTARVLVKRDCAACGEPFERLIYKSWAAQGAKGIYCSRRCAARGRWIGVPRTRRRLSHAPDHPLAGKNRKVLEARRVLYDAIGPGEHPCHWCGNIVAWQMRGVRGCGASDLAVDHLDGDELNDVRENLAPSCNRCNTLRGFIAAWQDETGRLVAELSV